MNSNHVYSPLPSANSIRLLRLESFSRDGLISCSLVMIDDYLSAPEYDAISYCWGDANDTIDINCDNTPFPVTKSLYAALYRLFQTRQAKLIWADAICINQGDILERNQQVLIMRHVYRCAFRVYIWAGHGDKNSVSAMSLIRSISYSCCSEAYGPVPHPALWLTALRQEPNSARVIMDTDPARLLELSRTEDLQPFWHFYQADWFYRVWVIQEVQGSPHIHLLCGKEELEWGFVALAAQWAQLARNQHSTIHWRKHHFPSYDGFRNTLFMWDRSFRTRRKAPFPALLNFIRNFRSTDSRDKVFAVLQHPITQILENGEGQSATALYPSSSSDNTLISHLNFRADYNVTPCEVFRQVALDSIKCYSNLEVLSYAWQTAHFNTSNPSWVPRWDTTLDDNTPLLPFLYDAARGTCPILHAGAGVNTLSVQGLIIGPILETDTVLAIDTGVGTTDYLGGDGSSIDRLMTISRILVQDRWQDLDDLEIAAGRAHKNLSAHFADFSAYLLPLLKTYQKDCYISLCTIWCSVCKENICVHREPTSNIPMVYNCQICDYGDYDLCSKCYELGIRCKASHHALTYKSPTGFWCPYTQEIINQLEAYASNGIGDRFFKISKSACRYRTFLRSFGGWKGVGPQTIEPGDTLVVLFGSRVPFVLRKCDTVYRLVGDCYFHNIMDGEAIQMWEDGKLEVSDFDIR